MKYFELGPGDLRFIFGSRVQMILCPLILIPTGLGRYVSDLKSRDYKSHDAHLLIPDCNSRKPSNILIEPDVLMQFNQYLWCLLILLIT